ncbi:MAG: DUF4240 domain-containing protein [Planctomycetota bacterium]|jgi:hypothetical protein
MTRDDFWQLVAQLIAKTRGNLERFTTALDKHLKSLAANEIEDFARHYAELQNEANTTGILEAAYIIGCGASNDGFMDFRRWIVFQGEADFKNIVDNPDYLGAYDRKADPIEQWHCEYHPMWAYEEATGKALQHFDVAVYPDAESDFDKPKTLAKRYPKLWKRIQGKKTAQQTLSNRGEALFLDATLDRIEANKDTARFVFSTGAEIRIRGYWKHYRTRYKIADDTPCYDEHPMVGQTVVSIKADYFPSSFFMWFDNRKKLSLGCDEHDCSDFDVFDNGTRIDA